MRRLSFFWLVVLTLLGWAGFANAQRGQNTILLTSDQDGNREIYAVDVDGSNLERLTTDPGEDVEPAWSPDHAQIAFASNRDGNFAIYLMNPDGNRVKRITEDTLGNYNASPAWSPDGQHIAFVSNANGNTQIYIIGADGSNPRAITDPANNSLDPSWSPDGEWIAFATDADGASQINIIRPDGSDIKQLTHDDSVDSDSPAWSRDGSLLAFAANGDSGEIDVMDADGSNTRLIAAVTDGFISSPAWSDDGDEIAYVLSDGPTTSIYIIGVDGKAARPLPGLTGEMNYPSWASPQQIAPIRIDEPDDSSFDCPGAAPPRLRVGENARVLPGTANNLRGNPSLSGGLTGRIPGGRKIAVLDGPRCSDGYVWWQVNYNGSVGWTAEGEGNDYWIEPLDSSSSSSSSSVSTVADHTSTSSSDECPGAMDSIFSVGDTAVVDFGNRSALRVLTRIGGGAGQTIAQAYNDDEMVLLDGPECGDWNNDKAWYWYVNFQGYKGWVAESSPTSRWLCPESDPECGY